MSQKSSRFTIDIALIAFFGLLAALGCLCSFSSVMLSLADAEKTFYEIAPFFLGLTLAGGGSAAMVALRQRFKMGWPLLIVAIILWSMGSAVFAFGLMAAMLYDEPNEFASNLGYSVGLCIGPGLFLALIGLFVFGYEAWRETEGDAFVSPDESANDWLESVKVVEKSKLDDDTF